MSDFSEVCEQAARKAGQLLLEWQGRITAREKGPRDLVTEADLKGWTQHDLDPYLDHVFNCFGLERVMYGGDWPVCTLAGTYRKWFDTLSDYVSRYSDEEQRQLFYDNADVFYRLG